MQVIKGWRSADGQVHEQVFDVALSGARKVDDPGKARPVGSTVHVREASYTNIIGNPELAAVWTDPRFKASEPAFYSVRVIEVPTPRWTAHDAKVFKNEGVKPGISMTARERAYTSPIWYTPPPEPGVAAR